MPYPRFMGLRKKRGGWRAEMLDVEGERRAHCRFGGERLRCREH